MLRKRHIPLVFIFITIFSFKATSQSNDTSGIVSYTYYSNLGRAMQSDWNLLFEGNKSIFIGGMNVEFVNSSAPMGSNDKSFEIKVNDQLTPHIINDYSTDSIYSQGLVFRDPYYVQDPILNPEWKLRPDTKLIAGFNCKKATTEFRGRVFEVWYTPDIPVNFGPWKLNGLPGLILLATDSKNEMEFKVTKVKLNENINIENQIAKIPKLGERVSLREYVAKKDKEGEQLSKYISSKVSRGNNTTSSFESAGRENQMEIIYEWEEK